MTYNEAFEILLKDGTIYQPPQDAIFDLVDAVLRHDINSVYSLYADCIAIGESPLVILSVLFNSVKQVLQVLTFSGNDICKSTGLSMWQIKKAQKNLRTYSEQELERLLGRIQKCESGIKSGKYDSDTVIDYLLVHTM